MCLVPRNLENPLRRASWLKRGRKRFRCLNSGIHHGDGPGTIPCPPNIQWILLGIDIDSCRLFARRMAVWLHIIARLQDKFALAVDDCPKQAAGKGSLERAVAKSTAGIGICRAEVLEIVVGIGGRYIVCANVLRSFDGGQQESSWLHLCSRKILFGPQGPGSYACFLIESHMSLLRTKMGLLTMPVVAVAQGPVSVVVEVVVTYEYCLAIRCKSKRAAGSSMLRLRY